MSIKLIAENEEAKVSMDKAILICLFKGGKRIFEIFVLKLAVKCLHIGVSADSPGQPSCRHIYQT